MANVTILGAGRMGAALVTAFAKAGHEVTVWNRTASKVAPLTATGARAATSLTSAIGAAELVVDVVTDYETSAALLRSGAATAALRGKTLVELASGTPKHARSAEVWAKEHGIRYLDGAIMATPAFIAKPGCTILYSGPKELYATHEATLRAVADNSLHVGTDIGHANVLDNAILVVLWGVVHGMLQGAALCEAERFPLEGFASGLRGSWPIIEPTLQEAIARIGKRHWTADETTPATVAICHASVRYILETSKEHRLDLALPNALDAVFRRAVDAGHGDDDVAAVYEAMRER